MTTTETPAFICTVCARTLHVAHVPPTAPKCSSCGAKTEPNVAMQELAGHVQCLHCGYSEAAYQNWQCPKCGTVYCTFATREAAATEPAQ